MSIVVLTPTEHAELLGLADVGDPPLYPPVFVGHPEAVARYQARIKTTYLRAVDGTNVPVAWTARSYARNGAGEVEVEAQPTWNNLDVPGYVSVATAGKLLDAVGERGDRHFGLEFAFKEFGG